MYRFLKITSLTIVKTISTKNYNSSTSLIKVKKEKVIYNQNNNKKQPFAMHLFSG